MFKIKKDAMEVVIRHKIRLVSKKYLQVVGIDFNDTYTYFAKFTTIMIIFTIEVVIDLKIYQIDIKIVFLNVKLEEDIYIYWI